MSDPLYWGVPPPDRRHQPPVYTIINVQPGERHDLTMLNERVLGVPCHWIPHPCGDGRECSVGCQALCGDCPHCKAGRRRVWAGYIGVYAHLSQLRKILCLGPEGADSLVSRAVPFHGVRGQRLTVRRADGGRTKSLVIERSPGEPQPVVLQPHDLTHTLCYALRVPSIAIEEYGREEIPMPEGGA